MPPSHPSTPSAIKRARGARPGAWPAVSIALTSAVPAHDAESFDPGVYPSSGCRRSDWTWSPYLTLRMTAKTPPFPSSKSLMRPKSGAMASIPQACLCTEPYRFDALKRRA
jgi:hypothetical protein